MAEQYVARDSETGFTVTVDGEFPPHPDDRMRIARTTTLFTRLMSTLLQRDETQRRLGFRAIETQLEIADALIKQDMEEVQRLMRDTLSQFGVNPDHLREFTEKIAEASGMDPRMAQEFARGLGFFDDSDDESESDERPELPAIFSQLSDIDLPGDDETSSEADALEATLAEPSASSDSPLPPSSSRTSELQDMQEQLHQLMVLEDLLSKLEAAEPQDFHKYINDDLPDFVKERLPPMLRQLLSSSQEPRNPEDTGTSNTEGTAP